MASVGHASPSTSPSSLRYARIFLTLFSWYCISSSIILLTKWLFSTHFSHPLTVTTFSNSLTTIWAFICSRRPKWRPEPLTRKQFREYVLPIGIATALEIGCSNIALKLLTVSFGTIVKGGSPIFTFTWGLIFGIERFSYKLCLALLTIALGIALASAGEGRSFALTGFILQILATALGGLRWAMTQVLLKGSSENAMPPLTATLYTSPTTALCVLPFAVGLEGSSVITNVSEMKSSELFVTIGTMVVVGTLVFTVLISEYWLVNVTSSLAVSVAGVFKELVTIGGGLILFHEVLSLLNGLGFLVCHIGIFAYMWLRYESPAENVLSAPVQEDQSLTHVLALEIDDASEFDKPMEVIPPHAAVVPISR